MTGLRNARRGDPVLLSLIVFGVLVIPPLLGFAHGGWTTVAVPFWATLAALHLTYALIAGRVAMIYRGDDDVSIRGARRMWSVAAAAGACLLVGDLVQLAETIGAPVGRAAIMGGAFQSTSVAVALGLLLLGLLRFPSQAPSADQRTRLRLDAAVVMGGATTCGLLLTQLPAGEAGLHRAVSVGLALLIQPGLFLVAIFALVKLFLGDRTPFTRNAAILSGSAAAIQSVMQGMPDSAYLARREGAWLMAGNVLGSALLAIGAQVRLGQARGLERGLGRRRTRSYSSLPYGAVAITWAIAIGALAADGLTSRTWAVIGGTVVTTALVIIRQVTAFQQVEELLRERGVLTARLTQQAYYDALTGLANRALFMRSLAEALGRGPVTVFLIDLDQFKPVNDSYGHATGDRLLIEVGDRLRGCVRDGDTVARLGGDEFAVLVEDLDPDGAAQVRESLNQALSGQVRLGEAEVMLRASVGVATGHPGRHDPDAVLHAADMAMYAVKNTGRAVRR